MTQFTKPSVDLLIDLINTDNSLSLKKSDLTIGAPANNTDSTHNRNTIVKLTAKDSAAFEGSANVYYNRVAIASVLKAAMSYEVAASGVTTSTLLPLINKQFSVDLTEDDVVVESIDTSTLPKTYTLKAAANSYAFTGTVDISLTAEKGDLDSMVAKKDLNGFDSTDGSTAS